MPITVCVIYLVGSRLAQGSRDAYLQWFLHKRMTMPNSIGISNSAKRVMDCCKRKIAYDANECFKK